MQTEIVKHCIKCGAEFDEGLEPRADAKSDVVFCDPDKFGCGAKFKVRLVVDSKGSE